MSHATIVAGFYASLVPIALGFAFMVFWAVRIFPGLMRQLDAAATTRHVGRHEVAYRVLWKMVPAIVVVIVFTVPAVYFNHLLKQEDFCIEVIRVNHLTDAGKSPDARCDRLDPTGLFQRAAGR